MIWLCALLELVTRPKKQIWRENGGKKDEPKRAVPYHSLNKQQVVDPMQLAKV